MFAGFFNLGEMHARVLFKTAFLFSFFSFILQMLKQSKLSCCSCLQTGKITASALLCRPRCNMEVFFMGFRLRTDQLFLFYAWAVQEDPHSEF